MIDRWPDWPHASIVVVAPAACRQDPPRQRLAPEVGRGAGFEAGALREADVAKAEGALLVEDLHAGIGDERVLFHLLNLVRERKLSMLLTSRVPPGELEVRLPDLRSRLRALPLVTIAPPDEALLKAVLVKHFSRPATGRGAARDQLSRVAYGAVDGGRRQHRGRDRPAGDGLAPQGNAGAGRRSAGAAARG